MTLRRPFILAAIAAIAATVACSDIVGPSRDKSLGYYDWRLIVPGDSLTFHWPRNHLPVKYWVEDQYGLPGYMRKAITLWRGAFLYGEWDGTIVSDSTTADVIVRAIQPPPQGIPGRVPPCVGATDVDTVNTRFELRLPMRIYVYTTVPGDTGLGSCLARVSTHEMGHSLGLFQHSKDSLDLMYGSPVVDQPSDKDIRTLLYATHIKADMVPVKP